jgi:hypothetical protein
MSSGELLRKISIGDSVRYHPGGISADATRGEPFTREGMAINGEQLLLLPEDAPSRLFIFRWRPN